MRQSFVDRPRVWALRALSPKASSLPAFIGLELTVPDLSVECGIPAAKRRQLLRRELLNLLFD